MLFNSTFFIVVFLPLALAGWFLLQKLKNPVYAKIFLIGMSLWFYGYYNISYLWILVISMLFNYILSLMFAKSTGFPGRAVLYLGIFGNLGMLFYFKYFNFFIDNCNYLLHTDIHIEKIMLPLGISFFTFQQLSFCLERYKNKIPHPPIVDYGCFISFFPQLVAGPIVLYDEFVPRLQERKNRYPSADGFLHGMMLFSLGLAKKVLLADTLGILVNAEYANIPYLDMPSAWLTIICYMLELYFDFSGYCDMARALGMMFGFVLPENFNSPLMAVSVKDFWRRWHMTLSRFLSTYIYIPLGGNRKGKTRQCLNLAIVFLASGIWHGANWTFIVWGIMHGAAVVWETVFPGLRFRKESINRLLTGIYVTLSFSIFRCDSLKDAGILWKKLFFGGNHGMFLGMCNVLQIPENYAVRKALELIRPDLQNALYVGCVLLLLLISIVLVKGRRAEEWIRERGMTTLGMVITGTLFVWAFISLSQVSTFLYFNF